MRICSEIEAVSCIKNGDAVFVQGGAATPNVLLKAMLNRHKELRNIKVFSVFAFGNKEISLAKPEILSSFDINTFFVSYSDRAAVQQGLVKVIPCFANQVPSLFRDKSLPIDVAILNVSPPDENGYCSYGISCDISYSAVEQARIIIAQINESMPYSYGDAIIHVSRIDYAIKCKEPINTIAESLQCSVDTKIVQNVANEIPDGATLQIGVGHIPNSLYNVLRNHKNLGLHSEIISDGAINLIRAGVIDNSCKVIAQGVSIASMGYGSVDFYNFINRNASIQFKDISWVNDPNVISKNPKVMAVNSAIEIDITGQVCADSIGKKIYSGVGGQCDFARGASSSKGGKSFIVLPSKTGAGASRIVPFLRSGAGVTISRYQIEYVATEYGIVNLRGKSLQERAKLLCSIASPEARDELEREAIERYGKSFQNI